MYLIASSDDIECWIDNENYYLSSAVFHFPFHIVKHTYDLPIRHIMLGELEDDGLALIREFLKKQRF